MHDEGADSPTAHIESTPEGHHVVDKKGNRLTTKPFKNPQIARNWAVHNGIYLEDGDGDLPPHLRMHEAEDEMQPQMKEAYGKFAEGIKEECSVRAGADKGKPPMKPEGEPVKEAYTKFAEGLSKLCEKKK